MNAIFTRSRRVMFSAVLFFGSLLGGTAFGQTTHQVAVRSNTFTPKELTITVGDTVVWTCTQGVHNVNGNKATFPANPASFGNSLASNWTYSFVFTSPGVYNYQCDPHVDFGMMGKVTVVNKSTNPKLNVNFTGMTPHIGQTFTFYVKHAVTGLYKDTILIARIPGATFQIASDQIVKGESYFLDFFADLNMSGEYDAPPTDHAWRIELNDVAGDTTLTFTHNVNFTDIFKNSSGISSEPAVLGEVLLYPNPAVNQITLALKSTTTAPLLVSICNIAGSQMLMKEFAAGQDNLVIDVIDFSPGIYFLTMKTVNEVRSFRFVRQ